MKGLDAVKRILLVNESFKIGGIESALVNLANELQKICEVDILIYNPRGELRNQLHPRVNILTPSWRMQAIGVSMNEALHSGDFRVLAAHILSGIWVKLVDNALPIQWMLSHEQRLSGYDLAIAFRQESDRHIVCSGFSRYVNQCVDAKCKAVWLHYDPSAIDLDSAFNLPFYRRLDKVVCVSRSLMEHFVGLHPDFQKKADYCYNIVSREKILAMSTEVQAIPFPADKTICFSACRLSEVKALVRGIRAMASVFKKHPEILWYIAGDGPEKSSIQQAICESGLEDRILLIGQQSNPYPYMRHADLLMNVSYHEAAPMVFLEAHILGVPVFATRTSSADELLRDRETDFICENSEEGIRESFARLMDEPERLSAAKRQLETAQWPFENGVSRILLWMETEPRRRYGA